MKYKKVVIIVSISGMMVVGLILAGLWLLQNDEVVAPNPPPAYPNSTVLSANSTTITDVVDSLISIEGCRESFEYKDDYKVYLTQDDPTKITNFYTQTMAKVGLTQVIHYGNNGNGEVLCFIQSESGPGIKILILDSTLDRTLLDKVFTNVPSNTKVVVVLRGLRFISFRKFQHTI